MAQVKLQRQNENGSWTFQIRVSDGYDGNGRQRKKSKSWTTPREKKWGQERAEKEAQKEALHFEETIKQGIIQDDNIRFRDFAEKFINEYAKKNLKIKSWTEYEKQLERINPVIGDIKLKDLRRRHLNNFYASLQEDGENKRTGGSLSANTILLYHRCISSILRKAVQWEYIQFNPATGAELPKVQREEATYLDVQGVEALLKVLVNEQIKYRALFSFDLLTGLRRGELLGLRWCDVNMEKSKITVTQTLNYAKGVGVYTDTPKNKTSIRTFPVSPVAMDILREYKVWQGSQKEICGDYWKNTDGRVFTGEDGSPIHPDTPSDWFCDITKRATLAGVSVHTLRHTYASFMIAEKNTIVVVSKRLGHANTTTTMDIYAHAIELAEDDEQPEEKLADIVKRILFGGDAAENNLPLVEMGKIG